MSKMLIINLTRETQQVRVRHEDQRLDTVQVVGRGRTELREGMTVDSRWLHANPGVLLFTQNAAKPVAPQPVVSTGDDE